MYKGKPLIAGKPPWYRHYTYSWGWYGLLDLDLNEGDEVETDGCGHPEDGGGNLYRAVPIDTGVNDGGAFINLPEYQAKVLFREEE